jgi:hypothetical protein
MRVESIYTRLVHLINIYRHGHVLPVYLQVSSFSGLSHSGLQLLSVILLTVSIFSDMADN